MRVEYKLWYWAGDRVRGKMLGQYSTVEAAKEASGRIDWTLSTGGDHMAGRWNNPDGSERRAWATSEVRVPESDGDRISLALDQALNGGGIDGAHHKQWALDQIVRILAGNRYEAVIAEYRDGEDGPETYSWDEGIAP